MKVFCFKPHKVCLFISHHLSVKSLLKARVLTWSFVFYNFLLLFAMLGFTMKYKVVQINFQSTYHFPQRSNQFIQVNKKESLLYLTIYV